MATRNPNLNNSIASLKRAAAAVVAAGDTDAELHGPRGEWWWTGRKPWECPGFDKAAGVIRSLPLPSTSTSSRQAVLDYFDNCWTTTEVLFSCLQGTEAFVRQPYHQLRHPMMFYYAHPAVVYVNKFRVAGLLDEGIDAFMEQLFEVGVDEMSWDDLSQAKEDWPSVREAWAYRRKAYEALRRVIETHPSLEGPVNWDSPGWAIYMGFEHERIHIETSSVLIRELPLAFVRRPEYWPAYHPSTAPVDANNAANGVVHAAGAGGGARHPQEGVHYPSNKLVRVEGGEVTLGKPRDYPSFGFDNEYGSKTIKVPGFSASAFKVTNGEFHAFVRAGGYNDRRWWSAEGWGWRTFRNVKWPTFWVPDGPAGLHRYKLRLLFDAVDMAWSLPAVVNYHEAAAFLAWRAAQDGSAVAYRMVTEAEHMLMRNPRDRSDAVRAATKAPAPKAANGIANGHAANGHAANGHAANGHAANGHAANGHAANGHAANGHAANGHAANGAINGHANGATTGCAELDVGGTNPDPAMRCSGADAEAAVGFNVQLAHGSESPVDALPPSAAGFYDTFGSVWEWGEDHFAAFPGFRVHPYYDDFSAPCFAGLHQMIIGGSFMSTGQLCSKYARYQFRPHFFQHAGFRVVVPDPDLALYDMSKHSVDAPLRPFFETSCMDGAPPYVGDRPCCSKQRRERFTPTMQEQAALDSARVASTKQSYETSALMSQYLALHFGPVDTALAEFAAETGILAAAADFPKKCGDLVLHWAAKAGAATGRALDLGCAVGRSSFEMARVYKDVVGIDLSQTFIDAANHVKRDRGVTYELRVEGDIAETTTATLDPAIDTARCTFMQGDACALPPGLGRFDAVLAANLLCRVPSPDACLAQIDAALSPGGLLVLTSPFTWLEEYTERTKWVGGRCDDKGADGRPVRCADALKAKLAGMGYTVLDEGKIPLVIRETCRKYQLILAHRLVAQKAKN